MVHTKQTFTQLSTDANRPGRNQVVQHQPYRAKLLTHPNELRPTYLMKKARED